MCADDARLLQLRSIKDVSVLQNDRREMVLQKSNSFQLRCHFVSLYRKSETKLRIKWDEPEQPRCEKDLGIMVVKKLMWSAHTNADCG